MVTTNAVVGSREPIGVIFATAAEADLSTLAPRCHTIASQMARAGLRQIVIACDSEISPAQMAQIGTTTDVDLAGLTISATLAEAQAICGDRMVVFPLPTSITWRTSGSATSWQDAPPRGVHRFTATMNRRWSARFR